MDRERLLNSLHKRIAAYYDGDASLVLAPEALNEADQLLGHLGTPEGTDLTVLRAVGLVHLARWYLLHEQAPDQAAASASLAVGCLTPVYLLAPDAVSEAVADEIRPRLSPPEAGQAGQAHDLGNALGLVAHATGHPTAFQDAIPALVEEAVEVGREATTLSERDDPQRPTRLSNVALARPVSAPSRRLQTAIPAPATGCRAWALR